MATESGFGKGWQGFVDHKWSKKRLDVASGDSPAVTHYQEFGYADG